MKRKGRERRVNRHLHEYMPLTRDLPAVCGRAFLFYFYLVIGCMQPEIRVDQADSKDPPLSNRI